MINYNEYYEQQVGHGLSAFSGAKYQRGMGLGNIFRTFYNWVIPLFKTLALPLIKRGAHSLGTEAVRTAANIATDTLSGKDIEEATSSRAKEAFDVLKTKAMNRLMQKGMGSKCCKRKIDSFSSKKQNTSKRIKKDIFGF
jgi:hypothetical protein